MDARTQLRRYLEQRRDLGESEFLLDGMSVEEAMRVLGAIRTGQLKRRPAVPALPTEGDEAASITTSATRDVSVQDVSPADVPDREAPSGPQAVPVAPRGSESVPAPALRSTSAADDITQGENLASKKFLPGLVVGSKEDSLFEANPFARVTTLDGIAKHVQKCTLCDLYKTATNGVPGEGDPEADVMCVGEAPGANEDATGRPFVGAAGQLLTKILAAIKLEREQVFIANVLKHRPPGNRNPMPDEVRACSPYLVRQIELVKPKVIIAFGTFAAQTLLQTKTPIGKLRGMVHRYYGVPLVVTYHPAALLRNPAWKRPTWEDVQLARRVLDSSAK